MEITDDKIIIDRNKDGFLLIYDADDIESIPKTAIQKVIGSGIMPMQSYIEYLATAVTFVPIYTLDNPNNIEARDKVINNMLKDIKKQCRKFIKWEVLQRKG